jgi:hypothetical protein
VAGKLPISIVRKATLHAGLDLSIDVRMLLYAMESVFKVIKKPLRKAAAFIAVELCRRIGFGQSVRVPQDCHALYFALS